MFYLLFYLFLAGAVFGAHPVSVADLTPVISEEAS